MNKLFIESLSGERNEIPGRFRNVELHERTKRAVAMASLGLGLAVISLPLPGLHFFLVPSFLIFSIYSGAKRANEKYRIELSDPPCPICNHLIKESITYTRDPVLKIYCYECRTQLRILEA